MATLAIKGHSKRGSEVIERLEMLGGNNKHQVTAIRENYVYFVDGNTINFLQINQLLPEQFIIYSLEEFLEKFPYKVGDKVSSKYIKNYKIVKMKWEDTNNRVIYKLQGMGWYNADELGYYKEETMEEKDIIKPTTEINLNHPCFDGHNEIELIIPNGWKFEQRGDKVFGIRKHYPKTYEECFNICFGNKHHIVQVVGLDDLGDNKELFESFIKLKICRDAYWKIAGEKNKSNIDYVTCNVGGKVINTDIPNSAYNHILAFPTEEMRDAFYENFKELINDCKELL